MSRRASTSQNSVSLDTHVNESPASVLAVVVTYNPDVSVIKKLVKILNQQHCRVLLVDNGSTNQADLASVQLGAELILNNDNLGLGTAHNQGLAFANECGVDCLLILDQDSLPLNAMVTSLMRAHQEQSRHHKVSAVGACYLNADNQSESFFARLGALKFQLDCTQ